MNLPDRVFVIEGPQPGPTVAIFAGVHGDEPAGVLALQDLVPTLKITKGKLYIAYANPPAIAAGVRQIGKNLNRCFYQGNRSTTKADKRSRELMSVLSPCEALLDLHTFYDPNGEPFVTCEAPSLELAKKFDVGIISTGWVTAEPGATDCYMYEQGKIGICLECGPTPQTDQCKGFATKSIRQFLGHFDMLDIDPDEYSQTPKRHILATKSVYKTTPGMVLTATFHNFDRLSAGQLIATDGKTKILAEPGQYIIFPRYNAGVGQELCILGRKD